MSETREQFRERIGSLNRSATESRPLTPQEGRWREWPEPVDFANGAEAVAAQVLRDARDFLLHHGYVNDAAEMVHVFARERGIDLTEAN